jgi:1,3-beta-glucan synthase
MLPVILIPQIDKLHSMMLFWLRPSRQIRAPIYSMKQSKLRRRRVFRFAVLYFVLFIVFMGLIIAPVFVGTLLPPGLSDQAKDLAGMRLYQPNNQEHDNTNGEEPTGIKAPEYTGKFKTTESSSPKATPTPDPDTEDP